MYTGIEEYELSDEDWELYSEHKYKFNAKENQYLVLKHNSEAKDIKK